METAYQGREKEYIYVQAIQAMNKLDTAVFFDWRVNVYRHGPREVMIKMIKTLQWRVEISLVVTSFSNKVAIWLHGSLARINFHIKIHVS